MTLQIYYHSNRKAYFEQKDKESVRFDLYSAKEYNIEPNSKEVIHTDLKIEMPIGVAGLIIGRSGLSFNNSSEVTTGLVDPTYRGVIKVNLYNRGNCVFSIKEGNRIAQIMFFSYFKPTFIKEDETKLSSTSRDTKGFGSSGI